MLNNLKLTSMNLVLGALCTLALQGCTLATNFTECETDSDCAQGICAEGICEMNVGCTSRADCASVSDAAYCLANQCREIDAAQCGRKGKVFLDDPDGVIIPIGALMPLSGTNREKGEAASDGAELALRQINASGGSTSGKFGLIVCDTQYKADVAVQKANYMHEELGINAMLGAISSAETLAVVDQVATPKEVLLISPASTSPGLSRRSDFFWRTIASDAEQAPAMAELLAERGIERAVLLYGGEDDPYGNGFFNALTFHWAENPDQKPATLKLGTFDTSDPLASLEQINQSALQYNSAEAPRPQAIILLGSLSSSDLIAQIEEQFIQNLPDEDKPIWVLPEALRDRTLLEKQGIKPAFERIIGTAPLRTETPIYSTYETLLDVTFGRNALDYQFPDKAYDAAYLLALTYGAQQTPALATGAQLNSVMNRVASSGEPSNLLGNQYSLIAGTLRDGQSVNLVGVSGELDFNDAHDVSNSQITTWTIDVSSGTPQFMEDDPTTE